MLVIGLTAFVESFVFLSLLFPGTAILIAAGTLVSEGILSPVPTVVAGIAGAVLGNSVSFWLGQKFGPLLPKVWPFRTHPERLMCGIGFFKRYGVHSVFIGQFLGPLRAVIPLVAGMMHMPPLRFNTANVLSAVVWAPALVLFGDLLTSIAGPRRPRDQNLLYHDYRCGRNSARCLDTTTIPCGLGAANLSVCFWHSAD